VTQLLKIFDLSSILGHQRPERLALPGRKAESSTVVIVFNDQQDPAVAKAAIAIEKHPFGWHPAPSESISARLAPHSAHSRQMQQRVAAYWAVQGNWFR